VCGQVKECWMVEQQWREFVAFYKVRIATALEYEWQYWPQTNNRQMKLKQLKC